MDNFGRNLNRYYQDPSPRGAAHHLRREEGRAHARLHAAAGRRRRQQQRGRTALAITRRTVILAVITCLRRSLAVAEAAAGAAASPATITTTRTRTRTTSRATSATAGGTRGFVRGPPRPRHQAGLLHLRERPRLPHGPDREPALRAAHERQLAHFEYDACNFSAKVRFRSSGRSLIRSFLPLLHCLRIFFRLSRRFYFISNVDGPLITFSTWRAWTKPTG